MPQPSDSLFILATQDYTIPETAKANKQVPTGTLPTLGYTGETVFAEHLNYMLNNLASYIEWDGERIVALENRATSLEETLNNTSFTGSDGIDAAGSLGGSVSVSVDNTVVRTSGNQTLAGTKTFSSPPTTTAPQGTEDGDLVRKDYSDSVGIWTRLGTPLVIQNGQLSEGVTLIPVGSEVPDNSEVKINFSCDFNTSGTSDEGHFLLTDGQDDTTVSLTHHNMKAKYQDSGSQSYATSGQIAVMKEGGNVRVSAMDATTSKATVTLVVTHYRRQG